MYDYYFNNEMGASQFRATTQFECITQCKLHHSLQRNTLTIFSSFIWFVVDTIHAALYWLKLKHYQEGMLVHWLFISECFTLFLYRTLCYMTNSSVQVCGGLRAYSHQRRAFLFCCGNYAADISKPHAFKWGTLADDVFLSANFTLPPKPRPPTGPI